MLGCFTDGILKKEASYLSEILPDQLLRLYLNFYEYEMLTEAELCSYFTAFLSNILTTSARVLTGVPNTEKQMKARGRRPSAFIVSRCLERLIKPEARVFEMASQSSVKISWNFFQKIGNQKV